MILGIEWNFYIIYKVFNFLTKGSSTILELDNFRLNTNLLYVKGELTSPINRGGAWCPEVTEAGTTKPTPTCQ
jgi:hypothetical protein